MGQGDKTIILNDNNFQQEVLQSRIPVLVDFYADWCGPCQVAGPVLSELAEEYEGKIKVGKLNVDEGLQTAAKYSVMNIPTVIVFKNGAEITRKAGFTGKKDYEELVKKVIKN